MSAMHLEWNRVGQPLESLRAVNEELQRNVVELRAVHAELRRENPALRQQGNELRCEDGYWKSSKRYRRT